MNAKETFKNEMGDMLDNISQVMCAMVLENANAFDGGVLTEEECRAIGEHLIAINKSLKALKPFFNK